jgi:hypothetical protein
MALFVLLRSHNLTPPSYEPVTTWESEVGERATDEGVDGCMKQSEVEDRVVGETRKSYTETLRSVEVATTELSSGKTTIPSIGFSDAV